VEARLRGEVATQLVTAQQRVAELTPLAEEAASLWTREAEARWHADEAGEKVLDLLERSRKDEEVVTMVRKERDELL
jgi:pyrroloquinoline quinone (PQQ) biosynthesis protein C